MKEDCSFVCSKTKRIVGFRTNETLYDCLETTKCLFANKENINCSSKKVQDCLYKFARGN